MIFNQRYYGTSVLEFIIYSIVVTFIYLYFRTIFGGQVNFVFSMTILVLALFVQFISGVSLLGAFLKWFDNIPFIYIWIPLCSFIFLTALFYESGAFWKTIRVTSLVSAVLCVILVILSF